MEQASPWGLSVHKAAEGQVALSSSDQGTCILIGSWVGRGRVVFIVRAVPCTHNDLFSWVFRTQVDFFLVVSIFGKQMFFYLDCQQMLFCGSFLSGASNS